MPTLKKQTFAKAAARTVTPASKNHGVLSQMNDEDLMSQFQMGTVEAFDILVSRYHDPLTNYIYRFLGDLKECEDLLQETFLRVYRNRHSYRRIAKFSTWLYTIAGNLARSEYRKRKRRRLYSLQSVNRDDEEYEVEIPDETFPPRQARRGDDPGPLHPGGPRPDPRGVPRGRRPPRRPAARLRGDRRHHGPPDGDGQEPHQPRPDQAPGHPQGGLHAGGGLASKGLWVTGDEQSPARD